jgi:hypothetical protein
VNHAFVSSGDSQDCDLHDVHSPLNSSIVANEQLSNHTYPMEMYQMIASGALPNQHMMYARISDSNHIEKMHRCHNLYIHQLPRHRMQLHDPKLN